MARSISKTMRFIYRTFGERFRRARANALAQQFSDCHSVLDVGGHRAYWMHSSWKPADLVILNLDPPPAQLVPGSRYIQGDALDIPFPPHSFDLAMSNSVIEHVPDQAQFAAEMLRVGKRVYCQTPSKWFPIEPHCLGLFVHWLPRKWFTHFVHRYLTLYDWMAKPDRDETEEFLAEVHLLGKRELQQMFPGCTVHTERFFGFAKSYIVTGGPFAENWIVAEEAVEPKRERLVMQFP